MTNKKELAPIEEKTILFYDDELTAVKLESGAIYVPVRRLCDNLGLDWSAQRQRMMRDEVLGAEMQGVVIITTPSDSGVGGGPQEALCLPLDLIPGWLFGVQVGRVRQELQPKLLRYRRECFRVLWDAFKADILPAVDEVPGRDLTPAEQALAHAEMLYNLARQQVAIERWLVHHDTRLGTVEGELTAVQDEVAAVQGRLDKAAEVVRGLQLRVYGPQQLITEEQAAELAELVKAIAHALTERDPAGKNYYQSVWSELHRRYGVTSYRRVPAARFGDVVAWLQSWLDSLHHPSRPVEKVPEHPVPVEKSHS